jgi:hypothetical protein
MKILQFFFHCNLVTRGQFSIILLFNNAFFPFFQILFDKKDYFNMRQRHKIYLTIQFSWINLVSTRTHGCQLGMRTREDSTIFVNIWSTIYQLGKTLLPKKVTKYAKFEN